MKQTRHQLKLLSKIKYMSISRWYMPTWLSQHNIYQMPWQYICMMSLKVYWYGNFPLPIIILSTSQAHAWLVTCHVSTDDVIFSTLTSYSSFSVDSLAAVGKYRGVKFTLILPPLLGAGPLRIYNKWQHQQLIEILLLTQSQH